MDVSLSELRMLVMDREAWRAVIHGVAKSRTWLRDWTELMSSASIQKLFCGIYSAFKCSFDEFVGVKLISPSYSSIMLGPPPSNPHI